MSELRFTAEAQSVLADLAAQQQADLAAQRQYAKKLKKVR